MARKKQLIRPNDGVASIKVLSDVPLAKTDLDNVVVRRGRRQPLTTLEIDVFCRVLDQPATFAQACAAIAVPERTMRDWLARGRDPDCDDQALIELATKYGAVSSGGYRDWAMRNLAEHAKDDPRAAKALTELLVDGGSVQKNMKVEMEVSPGPAKSDINWDLATAEEKRICFQAEQIKERLRALT